MYRHWGSVQAVRPIGGVKVQLYSFLTTTLEGSEWSASLPGRSLPPGKTRYPLYRSWVSPRAGMDRCEKSLPHRDSIPDRPARSQSLYRLSYRAHLYLSGSAMFRKLLIGWKKTNSLHNVRTLTLNTEHRNAVCSNTTFCNSKHSELNHRKKTFELNKPVILYNNINSQLDETIIILLIIWIRSACFGR